MIQYHWNTWQLYSIDLMINPYQKVIHTITGIEIKDGDTDTIRSMKYQLSRIVYGVTLFS